MAFKLEQLNLINIINKETHINKVHHLKRG